MFNDNSNVLALFLWIKAGVNKQESLFCFVVTLASEQLTLDQEGKERFEAGGLNSVHQNASVNGRLYLVVP